MLKVTLEVWISKWIYFAVPTNRASTVNLLVPIKSVTVEQWPSSATTPPKWHNPCWWNIVWAIPSEMVVNPCRTSVGMHPESMRRRWLKNGGSTGIRGRLVDRCLWSTWPGCGPLECFCYLWWLFGCEFEVKFKVIWKKNWQKHNSFCNDETLFLQNKSKCSWKKDWINGKMC